MAILHQLYEGRLVLQVLLMQQEHHIIQFESLGDPGDLHLQCIKCLLQSLSRMNLNQLYRNYKLRDKCLQSHSFQKLAHFLISSFNLTSIKRSTSRSFSRQPHFHGLKSLSFQIRNGRYYGFYDILLQPA